MGVVEMVGVRGDRARKKAGDGRDGAAVGRAKPHSAFPMSPRVIFNCRWRPRAERHAAHQRQGKRPGTQ